MTTALTESEIETTTACTQGCTAACQRSCSGECDCTTRPGIADQYEPVEPVLIVWSKKSGCVQCTMTHRKLEGSGIPYVEFYLEEHPEKVEEFKSRGLMSAPIVITADDEWAGFRPDKLDAVIALWRADALIASAGETGPIDEEPPAQSED